MEVCKSQKGAIVLASWVKDVDGPTSIQGQPLLKPRGWIYFPHETKFSQRTPREAALWNLLILFIPEVLGFLPNAYPSLFQYVIMVLTYVCSYQFI